MDQFGPGRSTVAILFFFVIFFLLGIVAEVVDRPIWDESQWGKELENFRRKYHPDDVKSGVDGPIPELIECGLDAPKKFRACAYYIQNKLQNEILLRKQFKDHNEDCNAPGTDEGDVILPIPKGDGKDDYVDWQEKVINRKLKFCDPHKYLRCSPEKKCVCLSGSIWSPPNEVNPARQKNTCVYSHHTDCNPCSFVQSFGFPSPGDVYFDPFARDESIRLVAPPCLEKGDGCNDQFRFTYFKGESYCIEGRIQLDALRRIDRYIGPYHSPNLLQFNDKCNSRDHNRLYTSTKQEDENLEVRFKTLEDFVSRSARVCDLQNFLTCGPSGKCECMPPTFRQDFKCVLHEEFANCAGFANSKMLAILKNETVVWRAKDDIMRGFSVAAGKSCGGELTCRAEDMEIYCTCPFLKTGAECNETLTKYLKFYVRTPSFPTDVMGYPAKIKFFSEFNKKVLQFERIFDLFNGQSCDWETQNEAEKLVWRIQKLKYRGTTMTKAQYKNLTDSMDAFTAVSQRQGICRDTLRCQYSLKICVSQTRETYLLDLRKELEKSQTLKCNEMGCFEFPKHADGVMFGGGKSEFYGGELDGVETVEYNRIIQKHSELLKTKSQFCSVGGSCSGSIPGKCDCQVVGQNKSQMIEMTQAFAHYCHLPSSFILLMSVAVIFVVSNC